MIKIHTGKLLQLQQSTQQTWKQSSHLSASVYQLQNILGQTTQLNRLSVLQRQLSAQLYQLQAFFHESQMQYESMEQRLLKQADSCEQQHPYPVTAIGRMPGIHKRTAGKPPIAHIRPSAMADPLSIMRKTVSVPEFSAALMPFAMQ